MKKVFVVLFMIAVSIGIVYAANTVTYSNRIHEITSIDNDWNSSFSYQGERVLSIRFIPGSGGSDRCVIKETTDSGVTIFDSGELAATSSSVEYYHGKRLHPYLDYSAGTYTTGATVTIILDDKR